MNERILVSNDGMLMKRLSVCERCWAERNGWKPSEKFMPIKAPVRVMDIEDPARCDLCGYPTWAGIFIAVSTGERAPPEVLALIEGQKK